MKALVPCLREFVETSTLAADGFRMSEQAWLVQALKNMKRQQVVVQGRSVGKSTTVMLLQAMKIEEKSQEALR